MNNSTKTSPKDVFMHLLNLAALYAVVINILILFFNYVDVFFRDPLKYFDPGGAIRWALSLIIVVFPVLLLISYLLEKDFRRRPEKRNLGIRKWLVYLTLSITAVVLIGDLIALIFNFMEGELTLNFCLKVLAVAAVAGSVFGWYFFDLRRKTEKFGQGAKIFVWIVSAVVLTAVVVGFFIAGSPFKQRLIRFDRRRIEDLNNLQQQITAYWQKKGKLPYSLDDLKNEIAGFAPPVDPQSDESYEYKITSGKLSFELCAVFSLDAKADRLRPMMPNEKENFWDYQAGRFCFERTIDPEIYKKEYPLIPAPSSF